MVGALFAQQSTYIDWGIDNRGGSTQGVNFYVEVYVDSDRFINYLITWDPMGGAYGLDWTYEVATAGQHTLRIVVDPDNRIAESNENNNVWQGTFYWSPATDCRPSANQIVLYEHTWYMGQCLILTVDTPDLRPHAFDNIASSIHFGSLGSLQTRLYDLYNYGGAYRGFTGDHPDFNVLGFNDMASSVRFGVSEATGDTSMVDDYVFDAGKPIVASPTVMADAGEQPVSVASGNGDAQRLFRSDTAAYSSPDTSVVILNTGARVNWLYNGQPGVAQSNQVRNPGYCEVWLPVVIRTR